MVPLSVLDLASIGEGFTPADAFTNTLDLAQHAAAAGFARFWLAEHHNLASIASAALWRTWHTDCLTSAPMGQIEEFS
jgi:alkanesulfonate monooxygenase SsuD/methylene tetrahydromethanopterin reductase-like flavin-dependent oxidoreductase (luciferase family)